MSSKDDWGIAGELIERKLPQIAIAYCKNEVGVLTWSISVNGQAQRFVRSLPRGIIEALA